MEHITIKVIGNGLYRLTPDDGYVIKDKITGSEYSDVITKKPSDYKAVRIV